MNGENDIETFLTKKRDTLQLKQHVTVYENTDISDNERTAETGICDDVITKLKKNTTKTFCKLHSV